MEQHGNRSHSEEHLLKSGHGVSESHHKMVTDGSCCLGSLVKLKFHGLGFHKKLFGLSKKSF